MTDAVSGTATTSSSSSSSNILAGQQNLSTSYDTFLQLLTTQLKNQDPTSPLDTNQFTQQLVQMTGVQQQLYSNELLQQLVTNGTSGSGVAGAVGLIGKTVTASSPTAALSGGQASWDYSLGAAASTATATIKNASGTVVWSGTLPNLGSGQHTFSWNGKSSSGAAQADGDYTLSIAATNAAGQSITTGVLQQGVVGSVSTDSNGVELAITGRGNAPISTVTSVTSS